MAVFLGKGAYRAVSTFTSFAESTNSPEKLAGIVKGMIEITKAHFGEMMLAWDQTFDRMLHEYS